MSKLKVKTILVSQPEPKVENSPYFDLQQKHKVKIEFRPFIHVEGLSAKDIRAQKIDLNHFSAIILTSKNAVDHFFRVKIFLSVRSQCLLPSKMRSVQKA